ncbi:MAG: CBS domain-containing protein [Candidatus Cloacimonadaceae bacterium]|jgi:CBS domain-containing protein|nr:CBS domain-containing protein [Candidatus Cloacimonadota bacterium]MDY0128431.1 CBS domain-containing protein [Candidatus Cloacimonadaceae bacterium]MCB5254909.1 CBS domain-containing protein [Candidatus Cloacimonadota bacterium]MCK9178952.1 CBS domain-containing protein [Candidatus Cloacimonadota bacterium]MCK9243197.1 CBS domain-containing protein [Candidatus Cloacimonadota bacterium]
MFLSDLLDSKAILHESEALSKEQVYSKLVDRICKRHHLPICGEALLELILARDQVSSTAYPTGISIPHIRMDNFEDTVVAMAFLDSPLDYEGTPVHWVCLVITDKSSSRLYLNLVAGLLKMSKDSQLLKSMMAADSLGVVQEIKALEIPLAKEITLADIMESNPISISPDALLSELGDIISNNNISFIPVTDDSGNYLGEVSILRLLKVGVPDYLMMLEHVNFLRSYEPLEKLFEQEDILTVGEIMDKGEAYLRPDTSIPEAVFDMIQHHKRFYSVVDSEGKLVGVITALDIIKKVIKA